MLLQTESIIGFATHHFRFTVQQHFSTSWINFDVLATAEHESWEQDYINVNWNIINCEILCMLSKLSDWIDSHHQISFIGITGIKTYQFRFRCNVETLTSEYHQLRTFVSFWACRAFLVESSWRVPPSKSTKSLLKYMNAEVEMLNKAFLIQQLPL